jgi:hypothetical protein
MKGGGFFSNLARMGISHRQFLIWVTGVIFSTKRREEMVKRVFLVSLLGISLSALLTNDASAALFCYKDPVTRQYKCVSTGSLVCGVTGTGVQADETRLACTAMADNVLWAVACGNPGENTWTAPGINLAQFSGEFSGDYVVTGKDVDRNGRASVIISNEVPEDLLTGLELSGACPNLNWTAIDAVPCQVDVVFRKYDTTYEPDCLEEELYLTCSIDCSTLGWDLATQTFERRDYDCMITGSTKYRCP